MNKELLKLQWLWTMFAAIVVIALAIGQFFFIPWIVTVIFHLFGWKVTP